MGIRTNNENVENFGTLWKDAPAADKIEKTFNCHLAPSSLEPLMAPVESFRPRENSIQSMKTEVKFHFKLNHS